MYLLLQFLHEINEYHSLLKAWQKVGSLLSIKFPLSEVTMVPFPSDE
jgi:hypothetical protein